MKDFYKITEIAKLYGLCTDTLRYYEEQGLLSPVRDRNNYRLYGIQDICNLNIIRGLRELGLSTDEIRAYLDSRSVQSTRALLERQARLIEQRIAALRTAQEGVQRHLAELLEAAQLPVGVFTLRTLEARPCFRLTSDVILEENIDFLLKKLEHRHEDLIHIIGSRQMGATLDAGKLAKGIYNHFSSVFFITGDIQRADAVIPAGVYATMVYAGEYEQFARVWQALCSGLRERGLKPAAAPMELYLIDIHETGRRREYKTEVQVLTCPDPCPPPNREA